LDELCRCHHDRAIAALASRVLLRNGGCLVIRVGVWVSFLTCGCVVSLSTAVELWEELEQGVDEVEHRSMEAGVIARLQRQSFLGVLPFARAGRRRRRKKRGMETSEGSNEGGEIGRGGKACRAREKRQDGEEGESERAQEVGQATWSLAR
jgi:hypothetical protein